MTDKNQEKTLICICAVGTMSLLGEGCPVHDPRTLYSRARKRIKELETELSELKDWIPVRKRLPVNKTDLSFSATVLVAWLYNDEKSIWTRMLGYCSINFEGGYSWYDLTDRAILPSHWQPLPDPPDTKPK